MNIPNGDDPLTFRRARKAMKYLPSRVDTKLACPVDWTVRYRYPYPPLKMTGLFGAGVHGPDGSFDRAIVVRCASSVPPNVQCQILVFLVTYEI